MSASDALSRAGEGPHLRRRLPRPRFRLPEGIGLIVAALAVVAVLDLLPAVRLLGAALAPEGTLDPVRTAEVLGGRSAVRAFWATVETGFGSALVATALGASLALVLAITDVRGRDAVSFLFVLTTMIAPQVVALAFLTLAGPSSPLLGALGLAPEPGTRNPLLGAAGITLVLGLHHAPLVLIVVLSGLKRVPISLVEAASVEGASPALIVRRIVVPMVAPHLVAGALLAFVAGVGNFGIPALLGLPVGYLTLPTLIYRRITSLGPEALGDAASLSLAVALIAVAGVAVALLTVRRWAVPAEADRPMEPFWRLGRVRPLTEAGVALVLAVVLVLPLLSLTAAALAPTYGVPLGFGNATLDHFVEVLLRQRVTTGALRNSFLLAAASALGCMVLATLVAFVIVRRAGRFGAWIAGLVEVPYALPGIVLAVVCILLFIRPLPFLGISLYGTAWIILFAYLARFLPVVLKPTLAAMSGLDIAQEEAAALDGAGLATRLRFIVAPALMPAASAGGVLAFLVAFNELTVSALLWGPGTETVGVVFFSLEEAGLVSQAAALGIATVVIVTVAMLALDRLRHRLPAGVLPWRP